MVARSATATAGFVPAEKPRIAIASDGTMAAIHEPTRVTVIELPGCAPFAEVGIDPEAGASEIAWIGAPPRLAVLSRYAAHSTVHLLDPYGPRTLAEIRLETPMRLMAAVGSHALAVGSLGAAVLTSNDAHLTPYQFPARTVPIAAGAAAGQFVVALAGSIEEWDPQSRMPKRRLKLPKPAVITNLGGSERVVWMTTQQDPTRLDVFALVNRGQPKFHDLPEPIAQVASHPRSDLLACVGADSGRLYIVDLDGRNGLRTVGPEGIDRVEVAGLVVGRMVAVLAAQARRPIALLSLDGREPEQVQVQVPATLPLRAPTADPRQSSSLYGEDDRVAEVPTHVTLHGNLAIEAPAGEPIPPLVEPAAAKASLFRATPVTAHKATGSLAPAHGPQGKAAPTVSLAERFSSWRTRTGELQPREESGPVAALDTRTSWRDELAAWARGVVSSGPDRAPPSAPAIETLAARFDLAPPLVAGLALLYGAHLNGEAGVAPIAMSRVLGRTWNEALGRGRFAATQLAIYRDSRVRLAGFAQRMVDGLPPATGTIVGQPGPVALLAACVVVAPLALPIGLVAEATLPAAGGAILAGDADVDANELVLEARAHGAVAMLRVSATTVEGLPPDVTVILVLDDEALADHLELPRLM